MPESARRTLSRDTSADAEEIQIEIYRRMSPVQRLELVEVANRRTRELLLAGLRSRYPKADAKELFRRQAGLLLGEPLATEVYGPLDDGRSA